MNRVTLLAIAAGCLAMAGCESRTNWVKESAPAGQLEYDQLDCRRSSADYGYVDRGGTYGLDVGRSGSGSITAEEYRRCMELRGWRRERSPAPAARAT